MWECLLSFSYYGVPSLRLNQSNAEAADLREAAARLVEVSPLFPIVLDVFLSIGEKDFHNASCRKSINVQQRKT